jgi:hypothetical protein
MIVRRKEDASEPLVFMCYTGGLARDHEHLGRDVSDCLEEIGDTVVFRIPYSGLICCLLRYFLNDKPVPKAWRNALIHTIFLKPISQSCFTCESPTRLKDNTSWSVRLILVRQVAARGKAQQATVMPWC